jgi:hypothetical protein
MKVPDLIVGIGVVYVSSEKFNFTLENHYSSIFSVIN